jgi:hypothetical protein
MSKGFVFNESYFPMKIRYETDKDPIIIESESKLIKNKPFFVLETRVKNEETIMKIEQLPDTIQRSIKARLEEFSVEIQDTVNNAIANNDTWEDVRDEIFNGMEAIKAEANKAQKLFS